MAEMMIREAIAKTLHDEMLRDENVVVLGEDIVGGMGTEGGPEATGGIWGTSPGLCLLYTSPSPRDKRQSRMPSSA